MTDMTTCVKLIKARAMMHDGRKIWGGRCNACAYITVLSWKPQPLQQPSLRFDSLRYGSLPVSVVYVWRCSMGEMNMTIYLTCLVIVLELSQVSATGLCYPLPCHQVAHNHRGGSNLCPAQPYRHHTGQSGQPKRLYHHITNVEETWSCTWLFLSWLGQVGYAGVWAHEDIAGVQCTL